MAAHLVGSQRPRMRRRAQLYLRALRVSALLFGVASWTLPCGLHADAGSPPRAPQQTPGSIAPSPSLRPPPGDLDQRARLLFEAVVHDE
ncbi:MAG TPA: hypothetical protein VFZ61_07865, partial [Polyangiales bacterium]